MYRNCTSDCIHYTYIYTYDWNENSSSLLNDSFVANLRSTFIFMDFFPPKLWCTVWFDCSSGRYFILVWLFLLETERECEREGYRQNSPSWEVTLDNLASGVSPPVITVAIIVIEYYRKRHLALCNWSFHNSWLHSDVIRTPIFFFVKKPP